MSTPSVATPAQPNPGSIFEALTAYERSFALKAAIQLDLFTHIGSGSNTVEMLASATSASVRGTRILCDFLVLNGFLTKNGSEYALAPDSAMFLDRNSPAYLGIASEFLTNQMLLQPFANLKEVIQTGRTTLPAEGSVSYDNPIWVDFARQMASMMYPASLEIAGLVAGTGPVKVLDIAAGHGLFGIAVARQNPEAQITALDWPNVLAVAKENAEKFGVADRHTSLPGSAFEVPFGGPYDLVLVTNFFHHFDRETNEGLMRKIHAALKPGGRCVNLEFIVNEDRVSPPGCAGFAMIMLATTVSGDAYSANEYETMFANAGFASTEIRPLQHSQQLISVSTR